MTELTTEVTVTCSYCGSLTTIPFRHGAVMPDWDSDSGVHAFIPRLDGGEHQCASERHASERAWATRNA